MDSSVSFAAWLSDIWVAWSGVAPAALFLVVSIVAIATLPLLFWRNRIAQQEAERNDEWAREKQEQDIAERFARAAEAAVRTAQDSMRADKTAESSETEADQSKRDQLDMRYAKAIDQLGADENQIAVRIGGIYTLGAIAREAPKDQATIVEILAAYIREESPREVDEGDRITRRAIPGGRIVTYFHQRPRRADGQLSLNEAHMVPLPMPEDIRAALNVIVSRTANGESIGKGLDLSFTDLRGADLARANLANANLTSADLRYADLTGVNLTGATLDGARLEHCTLNGAYLMDSELAFSRLDHASLDEAVLDQAEAFSASFIGATLRRGIARRTKFVRCNLSRAVASQADFDGADLTRSNLEAAELQDAKNLTETQLDSVALHADTKLPKDLQHLVPASSAAPRPQVAGTRPRTRGGRAASSD